MISSLGDIIALVINLFYILTEFASSKPVPGLDGTLQMAFQELRQLMNLFLHWDWTNYVAEFGKEYSKYLRVNPQVCIVLLEK